MKPKLKQKLWRDTCVTFCSSWFSYVMSLVQEVHVSLSYNFSLSSSCSFLYNFICYILFQVTHYVCVSSFLSDVRDCRFLELISWRFSMSTDLGVSLSVCVRLMKTNSMHYLSSVYYFSQPLHLFRTYLCPIISRYTVYIPQKCSAWEGWKRSVGPIMWEMKMYYLVKEQRNILHEICKRKAKWFGQILRRNCLLQRFIKGKIKGG